MFPKGNTPEGLCDMLGNVWEWCGDWFGAYEAGYRDKRDKMHKVVRGGSWGSNARSVGASRRSGFEPGRRDSDIGFRCVEELR